MNLSFNILPIVQKEFRQIRRDVRGLLLLLLMPAFLLIMVGYALNFDVQHISLGFYDEDRSQVSTRFIESFKHSEYFNVSIDIKNRREIDELLEEGTILAAIVIPNDFSKNINRHNFRFNNERCNVRCKN